MEQHFALDVPTCARRNSATLHNDASATAPPAVNEMMRDLDNAENQNVASYGDVMSNDCGRTTTSAKSRRCWWGACAGVEHAMCQRGGARRRGVTRARCLLPAASDGVVTPS